ncbi:hypothetical protein Q8W71_13105 [Methylobacterium sp. NEAU 140]|nr:hypothetical protein [Methylobacterium sp. NEAU 140]MDP4023570.1 hypothetical protein [Methylobacterium sp. NEAU 140]
MLKTLLALLTVFAVVALHGLLKLPTLPFRAVRGLFRPASVRAAARPIGS